ncbi:MAG: glycosyltransferase family 4 protein [Firmicutes bacterium]|nr:glycosyltransferase family 4 protein [Bacillota bacterium]HPU01811.1 glycosyltransferase [Bacillota bacterium]
MHQCFAIDGISPGRRFYEIGRRLVNEGHQVTVITGNSELKLPLGQKKIGLLQKDGMAIVSFNLGHSGESRRASSFFARQAYRQGRRLPHPDLVLASSPPTAVARSACRLSNYYKVPLVLEIREIDLSIIQSPDGGLKSIISSLRRRYAQKAYLRADSIIVGSLEMAETAQIIGPAKEITILPHELDFENLYQGYRKILSAIKLDGRKDLSGKY